MKKNIIYGMLSLVVLVGAIGFSGHLINAKPDPKKDNKKHNITFVQTAQARYSEQGGAMTYRGRVSSFDNVSLSAEVSGKLIQGDVRFKAGERFSKGQVLIRIYSEDTKAALMSAKSSYLQVISNILPDIKVDFPEEYEKWLAFFKAIDVEAALPALPTIASDKEKVFLASNNVLASYYNLVQQEINLTRYTIYAPFNGSFKSVNKEIGAISSMGAELASLIRTDKLEIVVPVFPSDVKYIEEGEQVQVLNTTNGLRQVATVSRISDFVEANTQSVNVYLTYDARGTSHLLEGEYVEISFNGKSVRGFEIPREALVGGQCVYTLKNKSLSKEEVTVVRQLEDSYIIHIADTNALVVTESLAAINKNTEYQAR